MPAGCTSKFTYIFYSYFFCAWTTQVVAISSNSIRRQLITPHSFLALSPELQTIVLCQEGHMVEIKLTVCYTQETKELQVVLCMDLFSYENNY